MSSPSKHQPTEARKSEIAQVAAKLFNDRGFALTSMEDVAGALGVKKPTLYHYVQSKAQIVSWIHEECTAAVYPPLLHSIRDGLPAAEVLYRVACSIFRLLDEKPGYLRVYFENHRDLDAEAQERIAKRRDEYYGLVRDVIKNGVESGELAVRDANLTTMAFFGMCNWAYQWYRPSGPLSGDEVAKHLWQDFMSGISIDSQAKGHC